MNRPGSTGTSEIRILFVFNPERRAVLLVTGDKTGQWSAWYREWGPDRSLRDLSGVIIPLAEARYAAHLKEQEQ